MNKTTLIGVSMLIVIGLGVSSAYAITITLAGDVAVTEDLDVTGDITGPTINAINTAITSSTSCPPENIQHWDKVVFSINLIPFDEGFISPNGETVLDEFSIFDVKVLDDPNKLADLREKVVLKLALMGYQKDNALEQGPVDLAETNIEIIDVEYSIVCVQPGAT